MENWKAGTCRREINRELYHLALVCNSVLRGNLKLSDVQKKVEQNNFGIKQEYYLQHELKAR